MGTRRIFQSFLMVISDAPLEFEGRPFEDTIDGYFPLHISLCQMLERRGLAAALVTLEFAPIMHIPNLPNDAPVPLDVRAGFVGLIEKMTFCVTQDSLCGVGKWRWFSDAADNVVLNAMTRLAEPCYVTGRGFAPGCDEVPLLGSIARSKKSGISIVQGPNADHAKPTSVWGPFQASVFQYAQGPGAAHGPIEAPGPVPTGGVSFIESKNSPTCS